MEVEKAARSRLLHIIENMVFNREWQHVGVTVPTDVLYCRFEESLYSGSQDRSMPPTGTYCNAEHTPVGVGASPSHKTATFVRLAALTPRRARLPAEFHLARRSVPDLCRSGPASSVWGDQSQQRPRRLEGLRPTRGRAPVDRLEQQFRCPARVPMLPIGLPPTPSPRTRTCPPPPR